MYEIDEEIDEGEELKVRPTRVRGVASKIVVSVRLTGTEFDKLRSYGNSKGISSDGGVLRTLAWKGLELEQMQKDGKLEQKLTASDSGLPRAFFETVNMLDDVELELLGHFVQAVQEVRVSVAAVGASAERWEAFYAQPRAPYQDLRAIEGRVAALSKHPG